MNAFYQSYLTGFGAGEAELRLEVAPRYPNDSDMRSDMWYHGYKSAKAKHMVMSPLLFEAYFDLRLVQGRKKLELVPFD